MKEINVVWNITNICSFACSFCCVSSKCNTFCSDSSNELTLQQKIKVVDQLSLGSFRVDFSGGDILLNKENLYVIDHAIRKIGKHRVGVTLPGKNIDIDAINLFRNVSGVEISLDFPPNFSDTERPIAQNLFAYSAIELLSNSGINVSVQTVLRKDNTFEYILDNLYSLLVKLNIKKWSIIKILPSGRGNKINNLFPEDNQIKNAVSFFQKRKKDGIVDIHLQYLFSLDTEKFECRAVSHSIGITDEGYVVACFWARDFNGKPYDNVVLGKVPNDDINHIVNNDSSKAWMEQKRCVIFS